MNNELSIEIKTYAQEATNQLNKLKQSLSQLSGDVDTNQKKIQNTTSMLSKALNVTGVIAMTKQISRKFMDSINAVNGYSEALNLFNVVMGNTDDKFSELGLSATKFQNKMREAFGLQQTQTLTYQALYQSMAENMGIVSDKASIMSENTTKLINDLSSLYNRDEKTTAEALRAGIYAGQTKPLRSFGIDVTQTSLTPILEDLGIERTVNQLNQAERQILRYIAVLRQSSIAHGDWANTIESPSNQLRIFKNQLAETSVAIGSLFQGAFAKILPYANAILMVIKEVTNAIATMFGIEIEDYNSAIASPEVDVGGYYDDIADSVGGATKAVKQLKRETLSFDQIHNINENNDTGGSGGGAIGGGVSGGIDKRLLDAINGYDNGLDKVKMKATQIRDKIMDWLGFTKVIDPLTGKVSFKYNGLKTTIKNIWEWFKKLNPTAKVFVGLLTTMIGSKVINGFKKLTSFIGSSGLLSGISKLGSALKLIDFKGLFSNGVLSGIKSFNSQLGVSIDAWSGSLTMAEKFKTFLVGAGGLLISLELVKNGMKEIAITGETSFGTLAQTAGGTLGSIASGALALGGTFGAKGALVGGILGGISAIISGYQEYTKYHDTNLAQIEEQKKVVDEAYQSYINFRDGINDSFKQTDAEFGYYERLKDELNNIIDANGTIKQGYEERAGAIVNELNEALGLHIEIVNGHIEGWNGVSDAIDKAIEKEKAYAKLEVLKSSAQSAYTQIENAQKNVTQATENYNKALQDLIVQIDKKSTSEGYTGEILRHLAKYYGITSEELAKYYATGEKSNSIQNALNDTTVKQTKNLEELKDRFEKFITPLNESNIALEEAQTTLDGYNNTIKDWEYGTELATQGNYETLNQFFDYDRNIRGKNLEEQATYWNDVKNNAKTSLEEMNNNQEKYGTQEYLYFKEKYEKEIALADKSLAEINEKTLNSLIEQSQTIENLTPEIRDKWQKLANDNHDVYMEQMSKLPVETRLELLDVKSLAEGDLSDDLVNAFGNLATENKDKFIEKISPMPEETKSALSQRMQSVGYEVGDLFSTNVNDAGDNIDLQTPIGNELDKTSTSTKSGGLWEKIKSIGSNIWSGITTTLNQSATLGSGLQGFGANVLNSVKNMLGIHSPSKLMINAKVGNFLFDGILEGMEEEIPKMKNVTNEMISDIKGIALNGMNELNYDLASLPSMENNINKVNSISDNYYADLSASLIEQATYRGIARAISDYGLVQIDVNSKVEKGVITDVAVDGIKDYIRRTGSNPFDEVL